VESADFTQALEILVAHRGARLTVYGRQFLPGDGRLQKPVQSSAHSPTQTAAGTGRRVLALRCRPCGAGPAVPALRCRAAGMARQRTALAEQWHARIKQFLRITAGEGPRKVTGFVDIAMLPTWLVTKMLLSDCRRMSPPRCRRLGPLRQAHRRLLLARADRRARARTFRRSLRTSVTYSGWVSVQTRRGMASRTSSKGAGVTS
jgi:hypothetical protein